MSTRTFHTSQFNLLFWLALSLLVIVYVYALKPVTAQAGLSLGNQTLCNAYTGIPQHWPQNSFAGMKFVPAGNFIMGTQLGYQEERQTVNTQVGAFWIDQTEVTVGQFAAFVKATAYITEAEQQQGGLVFKQPATPEAKLKPYAWWQFVKGANWQYPAGDQQRANDNQPVTLVTLADALAYAKWLGHDLPTEAEWEYAAKAGLTASTLEQEPRDQQGKPTANFWQGGFPEQNSHEDGYIALAPVGCFPANPFGLYDTVGNAWEQTKDVFTASHAADQLQKVAFQSLKPNQAMTIKGGSHLCAKDFCVRYRPSARESHEANLPISHIGFRTVARTVAVTSQGFTAW